jgi:4-hydroxy-3-polyprenylbenzoate decarboxylase
LIWITENGFRMNDVMRVAIGISGASGAIYGVRLLEELKQRHVETHLVVSEWGAYTIERETGRTPDDVFGLASFHHDNGDLAARVSSGSFRLDAMVIAPCSMKTLAGVATGFTADLMTRVADVCLKEGRPLILLTRETPLSVIHLENMLTVARAGGVIMPPVPAFYTNPAGLEEIVDSTVLRIVDRLSLDAGPLRRWNGS